MRNQDVTVILFLHLKDIYGQLQLQQPQQQQQLHCDCVRKHKGQRNSTEHCQPFLGRDHYTDISSWNISVFNDLSVM